MTESIVLGFASGQIGAVSKFSAFRNDDVTFILGFDDLSDLFQEFFLVKDNFR